MTYVIKIVAGDPTKGNPQQGLQQNVNDVWRINKIVHFKKVEIKHVEVGRNGSR